MEIRNYLPADFDACLQIMQSSIPEYFHQNDLPDFGKFLGRMPGVFLVVVDDEFRILACGGIALGKEVRTEAVLCYGMVLNSRLRQGIGKESASTTFGTLSS